ncbi:GTPase HflX [Candidatus Poribacteria bacterium]
MDQIKEYYEVAERAVLVGVGLSGMSKSEVEESLNELGRLADTSGADEIDRIVQFRDRPDAAYFIGKGKAEEIATLYKASDASSVIFDADLSPAQTRNLEEMIDGKIIDRTRLILDIFALHARTKEAMLEVELAQLEYQLPRLTRMWTHLSRQVSGAGVQAGGIGTRGPGEKQLDIDRRLIRVQMSRLKKALEKIKRSRHLERQNREDKLNIALVGYTNAGKSTLMNALANENLYTDDKLFATLDSTTRAVHLSDNYDIMLTDTVGFIKRLPHHLVASFRATLEEVIEARMLLHVVDASQPNVHEQINAVEEVLKELGALDKPTLMAFNKIDALEDKLELPILRQKYPNYVEISALSGEGLDVLKAKLLEIASENEVEIDVDIPQKEGKIVNYVYEHGEVMERKFKGNVVHFRVRMDRRYANKLEKFMASVS